MYSDLDAFEYCGVHRRAQGVCLRGVGCAWVWLGVLMPWGVLMNENAAFDPLWFCAAVDESERRRSLISEAAYRRAQQRNFAPGHELEDWLAAEAEVDEILSGVSLTAVPLT